MQRHGVFKPAGRQTLGRWLKPLFLSAALLGTLLGGAASHAQKSTITAIPNPVQASAPIAEQSAQQVPVPPLTGHVMDLTGTLSQQQQSQLEQTLSAFEARKGSQLVVLLVPTTRPETIEQYALRVAMQWQLGRPKVDDGAMVVVAKNDRTVRIEVGYGLEGALNDATSKRIIEEDITPAFRQQDFAGGLLAGVRRMMAVIEGEALPAPRTEPAEQKAIDITWIIALGAVLGFVLRAVLGRSPGAVMTAAIVGVITWFLLGMLSLAFIAASITWLTTWIGLASLLRARYGGGRGVPGGGFKGGGGGFGGGGASGRW